MITHTLDLHTRVAELEAQLVQLRDSEERFRRLAENASDMIYRYEFVPHRRFAYVSPAAQALTGYTPDEHYADPELGIKITHPADRPMMRALLNGDFVWDVPMTLRWLRRDGKLIWTEQSNSPFFDATGQLIAIEGIARDITPRKAAEDALRHSAQRLILLHDIDRDILAARSPEATAQAALRHMRQLVPCRHASLTVIDGDAGDLTVLAHDAEIADRADGAVTPRLRLPVSPDWIAQLRQHDIVVSAETARLQGMPLAAQLGAHDVRSLLYIPLYTQTELIGALVLGAGPQDLILPEHLDIAHDVANSVALAIQNAALFRSVVDQHEQLRLLTARLSDLEETERQRLARELHDRIGQNLTALGINLNIVRTLLPPDAAAKATTRIDDSLHLVAETVERVRDVMAELRPPVLDDYGLFAALRWYADRFCALTGLPVTLAGVEFEPRLPLNAEMAIFRIAQEALTNVVRHAQATGVIITFNQRDPHAEIVIADDGVGFDPLEQQRHTRRPSWGLLTMQERAEAVDGSVHLDSGPGRGTRVVIAIER